MPRNRPSVALAPDDPRHGTANGYNNLGCRCPACRRAWSDWMNDYNHRSGLHRPREVVTAERRERAANAPHGTDSRYRSGCHCDECRAGQASAKRDWRRRAGRM